MKKIVVILVAVVFASALSIETVFHPRLEIHSQVRPVLPNDTAILLLQHGEPLAEIQRAVAASGKGVDEMEWMGNSLLGWAVEEKRLDVAEWLLRKGANPNLIVGGEAPLDTAIVHTDISMVKLLVKWGAEPDLRIRSVDKPPIDITPRDIAKTQGDQQIIDALGPEKGHENGPWKSATADLR